MRTSIVARWYPSPEHITYNNPEADVIRSRNPDLTLAGPDMLEVATLRRSKVSLTPEGKNRLLEIKEQLAKKYTVEIGRVKHSYNIKCGCTCPCSPGYYLKIKDRFDYVQTDKLKKPIVETFWQIPMSASFE